MAKEPFPLSGSDEVSFTDSCTARGCCFEHLLDCSDARVPVSRDVRDMDLAIRGNLDGRTVFQVMPGDQTVCSLEPGIGRFNHDLARS